MAYSVTVAQSHDESRGGRTVTGVDGSIMGKDIGNMSTHKSVMGEWLHGLLECILRHRKLIA